VWKDFERLLIVAFKNRLVILRNDKRIATLALSDQSTVNKILPNPFQLELFLIAEKEVNINVC